MWNKNKNFKLKKKMSASPMQRQAIVIPSKRVMLTDASQLPDIYSSTPNGTLYSTTPGGRIYWEFTVSVNIYRVNELGRFKFGLKKTEQKLLPFVN